MKTMIRIALAATIVALSGPLALAGKATELKPSLAKPGKLVIEEDFAASGLPKSWVPAKGEWQPHDGVMIGKEKKEDQHPAVLTLAQPNHNSIIRFSFKLDGTDGFALSYNSAKGHLFRIQLAAGSITINKDKDKKDPNSKSALLGKAEAKFQQGQWYTMLVEIQGGQVVVQTDNALKLIATNPELDVDKTGYRFVMRKASFALDDVRVWETQPIPREFIGK